MKKCKYFDKCSAPICPKDKNSLKYGIWYPNEPICKLDKYSNKNYIIAQKEIAQKAKKKDKYFTLEMLKNLKSFEGIDPNKNEKTELKKWFKK